MKKLEEEAKELSATESQIKEIEDEIRKTKYNKATQKHIGTLKAKLAKLREKSSKKSGGEGLGYGIKKSGDATVVLVGFPSVGKSTLLNQLSNAESKVAGYDFTTLKVIPGVLDYNGAKLQILDVPGLVEGASVGKGRGKEVLSVIRIADLVIFVSDASKNYKKQIDIMKNELYEAGFRLDQKKPDVTINKSNTGGVNVGFTMKKPELDKETIKEVLKQFGFMNGEIIIRENINIDQLIDCLSKNRMYRPSLTILNKVDLLKGKSGINAVEISALKGINLENLREKIWKKLGLMRVFMKRIGKVPDMNEPMIVKDGTTVLQVCRKIHKEFADNFKFAKVWGSSKFEGQKLGGEYKLKDRDILELHLEGL
ncbi:MAG: GTP-binding protein [Candidatus Aenigmarchaeota archaeon]|nr:GTP-binding protein [Candidatus Aenigmarchaeota archaeon]